jgi:hypothetical protein
VDRKDGGRDRRDTDLDKFRDGAPEEEFGGEENYSEGCGHYKQQNTNVGNRQIRKFIDYETPEMDTFLDFSIESSPRKAVCQVTSHNENVPDFKSCPTDNQLLNKLNPSMKTSQITKWKFLSRMTASKSSKPWSAAL